VQEGIGDWFFVEWLMPGPEPPLAEEIGSAAQRLLISAVARM
jgi:hypothetical protein